MCLRAAAHLPHQTARINRHSWSNLRDYMTDDKEATNSPPAGGTNAPAGMNKDEVALELTRFIAATTGLGKSATGTGFAGKTGGQDVRRSRWRRSYSSMSAAEPPWVSIRRRETPRRMRSMPHEAI